MSDPPETRPSLLVRIREPRDSAAWSEFVDLYAPLIYGFARKNGLQDADAADLTQEVLRAVARSARELDYDPQRGSFRAWLFTIARNKLRNFIIATGQRTRGSGNSDMHRLIEQLPDHDADQQSQWDLDYERRLFEWAAARVETEVEPATWRAFYETAVDGLPPQDVADRLGMTVANVYRAKSRVIQRLKDRIREMQSEEERLGRSSNSPRIETRSGERGTEKLPTNQTGPRIETRSVSEGPKNSPRIKRDHE